MSFALFHKTCAGCVLKHTPNQVGQHVVAEVDTERRRRVRAHHTATHLLQSALKKVLGQDTSQQGSMVNFDRLR